MKTAAMSAFALLLAVGAIPAVAATSTNPASPNSQDTTTKLEPEPGMIARQQLQNDLTKAGLTDIRIMPESFLVRAKDSKGSLVMMIFNPDSFTEVTMPNNAAANSQSGNDTNKSTSEKMTAPSPLGSGPC
jgi:hypothetical protein